VATPEQRNAAPPAYLPAQAPPGAPSAPGFGPAAPGFGPVVGQQPQAPAATAPKATAAGPLARLRRTADTAPGRLRLLAAGLAVLVLGLGALTGWEANDRTQAADQVVTHSQPLSQNAAEIYRSLADADTTAAAGFLLAGAEPHDVRQRYQDDLSNATQLLTQAAAQSNGSGQAQTLVSQLNQQLPVYAGLVETARADDRQGLPLGAAYLRYASNMMQTQLLPEAQKLSDTEVSRLDHDYQDAQSTPWLSYAFGLLTLGVLAWAQLMLFRRTNRVFNSGLLAATAAVVLLLGWLTFGVLSANSSLDQSKSRGATPLQALNVARIDSLHARTAENLNLVARGSTTAYADQWATSSKADAGALANAQQLAPHDAADEIGQARQQFTSWTQLHDQATTLNDSGDYQGALNATVGTGQDSAHPSSQPVYQKLDQDLADAVKVEQAEFLSAAKDGRDATAPLVFAAGALALLAAAGVLTGINRRLAEYR
jgi:CHASE3 domain sensor protein